MVNQVDACAPAIWSATPTSTACDTTPRTSAQLTYDKEGRLIAWQNPPTNPTTTDIIGYDGAGQRVEQQEVQSGATTTWVYIGTLAEYDTTSSGTTLYKYYSFAGRLVAGRSSNLHFFLTDQVGSIQVQVSAGGGAETDDPLMWSAIAAGARHETPPLLLVPLRPPAQLHGAAGIADAHEAPAIARTHSPSDAQAAVEALLAGGNGHPVPLAYGTK